MLKKYWKNAISLVLVVALLIGILPTAAHAQDALSTDLECDAQTGMSTIYEYQPFDIGKAGTAYLNTYLHGEAVEDGGVGYYMTGARREEEKTHG